MEFFLKKNIPFTFFNNFSGNFLSFFNGFKSSIKSCVFFKYHYFFFQRQSLYALLPHFGHFEAKCAQNGPNKGKIHLLHCKRALDLNLATVRVPSIKLLKLTRFHIRKRGRKYFRFWCWLECEYVRVHRKMRTKFSVIYISVNGLGGVADKLLAPKSFGTIYLQYACYQKTLRI